MISYGQFCPVAKASEVVGGRWTPLILRELMAGSHRFNDLQRGIPLISRTLLAQRLKELEEDGLIHTVERSVGRGKEYFLTPAGQAMQPVLEALSQWGQTWGQGRLRTEDLDAVQLMWAMKRHADESALPSARLVVRFDFRNLPRRRRSSESYWLVLDRPQIDVCLKNPGFTPDLVVSAELAAFTRVFLNYLGMRDAVRHGVVGFDGRSEDFKRLQAVLRLPEAPALRAFDFGEYRAAS